MTDLIARCEYCGRSMAESVSCMVTILTWSTEFGGDIFDRIAFGQEKAAGEHTFTLCSDCATPTGGWHHFECDWEQCPRCGEQLLGCACEFLPMKTVLPEDQAHWQMPLALEDTLNGGECRNQSLRNYRVSPLWYFLVLGVVPQITIGRVMSPHPICAMMWS